MNSAERYHFLIGPHKQGSIFIWIILPISFIVCSEANIIISEAKSLIVSTKFVYYGELPHHNLQTASLIN